MKTPVVTNEFERFDFNKADNKRGYASYILDDGTTIEYLREGDKFLYRETPADSYFILVKRFYQNGNIYKKGLSINSGDCKLGIWYYFDENGTLIKEENTEEGYKFTFDDLLKYIQKENIPLTRGHIENGYHTSIFKTFDMNENCWMIEWLKDLSVMPNKIEEITLSGKTGKVIKKNLIDYINN